MPGWSSEPTPTAYEATTLDASSSAIRTPRKMAPATNSVTYMLRREIGRASTTSSVPRWRSPATATLEKPTAKMPISSSVNGMDEAERDRAAQADDVTTTEVGELRERGIACQEVARASCRSWHR